MIVDSHCHLDMLESHDKISEIIRRAKLSGVEFLQTISVKLDNFEHILSIANQHENVFASVGIHPNEVKAGKVIDCAKLIDLSQHPKVIGLGETGLDYYRSDNLEQQDAQKKSFISHINASQNNGLPVIVHTREAEMDSLSIIKQEMEKQYFPFLIHCFTASKEFAKNILDLGGYISISGIVTFKNATDLQDIVKYLPEDRILVETDSPYLAPMPYRGKVNEPAYTKYVVEAIANLKSINTAKMAEITTENFFRLFTKAQR